MRSVLFGAGLCCALAIPSVAAAGTYHVSTDGSDDASGSAAEPWRTLQHAADSVRAGDTVEVAPGSYDGFQITTSGTKGSPIVFRGQPGAVIDEPNDDTPDGINIEGADHVVIEGFELTGLPRAGVRCAEADGVVVRNNVADRNGRWGIFSAFCNDLVIENNQTSRSAEQHGIYTSNSGDRPIIRGNVSFGNERAGIHMNGDINYGGDGLIQGALVENNVIYDNGDGGAAGINCDGVQDSIFRNNLLYDNHANGIALYSIDGADGSKNNLVVNNTIVMASDGRWALHIRNRSTGNVVVNNILLNRRSSRGAIDISTDSLEDFRADYNVAQKFTTNDAASVLSLDDWRRERGLGLHSIDAGEAELFVDGPGGDFHLAAQSPALDAGVAEHLAAADLDGNPRMSGGGVDLGAYEQCPAAGCEPPGEDDGNPEPGEPGDEGDESGPKPDDPGAEPGEPCEGADCDGEPPLSTMPSDGGCRAGGSSGAAGLALALGAAALLLGRRRRRA